MEPGSIVLLIIVGVFYFLPAAVASLRQHHNEGAIWVLNLFLGWTFLGWVVALVWACTVVRKKPETEPSKDSIDAARERWRGGR